MSSIERSNGPLSLGQLIDRKLQRKVSGVDSSTPSAGAYAGSNDPANSHLPSSSSDQSGTSLDAEFANLLFGKTDVQLIPKLSGAGAPFFESKQKIVGTKQNFLTLKSQEDCKSQSENECQPVEFQLVNVLEHPIAVSVQKRRGMVKMVLSLPKSSSLDAPRAQALERVLQTHFTKTLGVDFLVEVKIDC